MAQKKGIVEKITDGVDKILDVKGPAEQASPDVKPQDQKADENKNQPSEGYTLPKFQKFKRG